VKLPQLVCIVTAYVFDGSSFCVGFAALRVAGFGCSTVVQPFAFVVVAAVVPCESFEPPPPQAASTRTSASGSPRRSAIRG
jgi:hypothetical protein